MNRPHEDPNCRCKACDDWHESAKRAENMAAAGREFQQRMFTAWHADFEKGRNPDAVFVNPAYAKACGVTMGMVFGGVRVITDHNVPGRDIYPFRMSVIGRALWLACGCQEPARAWFLPPDAD